MEEVIDKITEFVGDEFSNARDMILEEFENLHEKIDSMRVQRHRIGAVEHGLDSLDMYETVRQLGEGAKGLVCQVMHKESKHVFAKKTISLTTNMLTPELVEEISVLFKANHDHIVKLEEVIVSGNELSLVMEYANGDLNTIIQTETYEEKQVKIWLRQLLCAIEYLHQHEIIHRDIKPENILIDDKKRLILADFGSVKRIFNNCDWTPKVVTLAFRAPEVLLGSSYGKGIDIWAAGCVFYEMMERKSLFGSPEQDSEMSILLQIFRKLGTPKQGSFLFSLPDFPRDAFLFPEPSMISPQLDEVGNDLMMKLLEFDPTKRMSAQDALNHPYLKEPAADNDQMMEKLQVETVKKVTGEDALDHADG